jgi:hypothetical protein
MRFETVVVEGAIRREQFEGISLRSTSDSSTPHQAFLGSGTI